MTKCISHQRLQQSHTTDRDIKSFFYYISSFSTCSFLFEKLLGFVCLCVVNQSPSRTLLLALLLSRRVSKCCGNFMVPVISFRTRIALESSEKRKLFHLLRGFLWKLFLWFSHSYDKHENCTTSAEFYFSFYPFPPSTFELWYPHIQRGKKITLRKKWKLSATHLLIIYFSIIIFRRNFITFSHKLD